MREFKKKIENTNILSRVNTLLFTLIEFDLCCNKISYLVFLLEGFSRQNPSKTLSALKSPSLSKDSTLGSSFLIFKSVTTN